MKGGKPVGDMSCDCSVIKAIPGRRGAAPDCSTCALPTISSCPQVERAPLEIVVAKGGVWRGAKRSDFVQHVCGRILACLRWRAGVFFGA